MIGNAGKMQMVAKTFAGLEDITASELQALGATDITPLNKGVLFTGDQPLLYRACLSLRSATRVLVRLSSFNARNEQNYIKSIQAIDWGTLISLKDSLGVEVSATSDLFSNPGKLAFLTKETIVDAFRRKTGRRPNVNAANPTVRVHVAINQQDVAIYLDACGAGLQWRGWRRGKEESGWSDAFAAGVLLLSPWRGGTRFLDVACGTGQVLSEAAMIAAQMAPGISRESFGFQSWPGYDQESFRAQRAAAVGMEQSLKSTIEGWTRSPMEISMGQRMATAASTVKLISFEKAQFMKQAPSGKPGTLLVCSEEQDASYYEGLSKHLLDAWKGWELILVAPNGGGLRGFTMPVSKRHILNDGKTEYQWIRVASLGDAKAEAERAS